MLHNPDLNRHLGKYYGKYSGEVVDNKDPGHMGRIKVKVPSVLQDLEVTARPCFPSGHFYVPPAGAKVWVEFEAGDPGHPIWVGTWYPEGAAPPEAAMDPPDARVIHTPSGHTIEILDKEGEEKIVLKHKGNAFVSIDKNGSVLISNPNGSFVFLNADKGEMSLVEEHGTLVSMTEKGVVIANKDGTALQISGESVSVIAKEIVLHGQTVALGGASTPADAEPALLSTTFMALFNAHTHPTAVGPSGPPVPPLLPKPAGAWQSGTVMVKK